MDFKYKIADVAKEFGVPTKKVIETVAPITGESYKTGSTFGEKELNLLLETLTRENAEGSLDAYLASGAKEEPAPAPKAPVENKKPAAEAKKPEQKPAPKAEEKKPEAKNAEEKKPESKKDRKAENKPAEKRSEKRVTLQELAADTGIKEPVKAVEQVQVNRAQVSVDTRTVDVNVDKFNARYDDLADSRNMPSKRKNQPTGKKEKFNNRNNRRGQQFGRRRETEAERLQRIQLEKARNAQLKISIPDEITVGELAARLKQQAGKVIAKFMQMGEMHAISDVVDFDTAALIAEEFHAKVEHEVHVSIEERLFVQEEDNAADLVERPPVVVVMGHVDHGKTSILDAIRHANVTAGEAGGITQHIGAYRVNIDGKDITFLDTPGHAAFTTMRARGAMVTDIAVLVVAADDGIMPQTVEAIRHAQAAEVPIVVAINKIDLPGADPLKVKTALLQHGIAVEEMGGESLCAEVSAKKRINIDKLVEAILLQAEILDLKADPTCKASGTVIEAKMEKGRGSVATLLVQKGTLKVGDIIIAGKEWGHVRAMFNEHGHKIFEAGPATPVEVIGLQGTPAAGDNFNMVESESQAKEITNYRIQKERDAKLVKSAKSAMEQMLDKIKSGESKHLPVIIKADVQGSVEAIEGTLNKLSNNEVSVQILHSAVGPISESDITLAKASNALIIGFNVRAIPQARDMARRDGVDIRYYSIIYDVADDVKKGLEGLLSPELREKLLGYAEIRNVFNITGVGRVAGCMVTEGMVKRGAKVRLLRDNVVIHDGSLGQLKRFKDDVKEVKEGYECGMSFENYNDIQVGDFIECYEIETIAAKLA